MQFPVTVEEILLEIAKETARMSYPANMSRGKNPPVVSNGENKPKARIEKYFTALFPLPDIWHKRIGDYDTWHQEQAIALGNYLRRHRHIGEDRISTGVAVKFLDTYMHQLMKYEQARYLWSKLHLPLDQKIFNRLKKIELRSLTAIKDLLKKSPYKLNYAAHSEIQLALARLVKELNKRKEAEYKIGSRVELNWLWSK